MRVASSAAGELPLRAPSVPSHLHQWPDTGLGHIPLLPKVPGERSGQIRHHLLPVHGPVLPSQQGVGSGRCGKDGPCRSICWDSNLGPTSGWEQNTEVQLPVRLLRRQLCISLCAYIITQQLSLLMWDTGQATPTRSHGDVPALSSRQSFCHAWLQGLRTTPLFLPNRSLPLLLRTTAGSAGH